MNQSHSPAAHRAGFTLVELLVVITIIGMLMALLIPAVGAARATARNAACNQQQKQIGLGLINYQTQKQRFPGYVQPLKRSDGVSYVVVDSSNGPARTQFNNGTLAESQVSWAGVIAPFIDKRDVYDLMIDASVVAQVSSVPDATNQALIRRYEVLICPADDELKSAVNDAGMTYSVNTGAWDYEGASDPDDLEPDYIFPDLGNGVPGDVKANGVFHNLRLGKVTNSMDAIRDGLATTILFSENIHKERETQGSFFSWVGVGYAPGQPGRPIAEQQFGICWTPSTQPSLANDSRLFQQRFSTEDLNNVPPYPSNTPAYARPASSHATGAFNVCFADGHTQSVAADIDYTVYQRLMTPDGTKCEDPAAVYVKASNTPPAINAYRRLAPLAETDY